MIAIKRTSLFFTIKPLFKGVPLRPCRTRSLKSLRAFGKKLIIVFMHSKKKKLLQHLRAEVFCRLGVSPVHGIGVFAIREIPKGTKPLKSRLKLHEIKFNHAEVSSLPSYVRKELDMFCYYDKHHMLIPAIGMNAMNMSVYLNHSKKPNLKMRKDGDLIALREIKPDEELVMDYDDSFGEAHTFGPGSND